MAVKLLLFVLLLGFRVSSSSCNQYNQSTTLMPCPERYIAEAYFTEYDTLVDSNFNEYMQNKFPLNSVKPIPTLLNLDRHLIGEGSHRRLSSAIQLNIHADLKPTFFTQLFEVIIIERLPSGVFADPFELEHLVNRRVFKDASVFGDLNLELPSFRSSRSVVEVHLGANVNKSVGCDSVLEFATEIPLHARYVPLEDGGYSDVRFNDPDILVRFKSHEELQTPKCLITLIETTSASLKHDIVWSIPSGINAHASIVYLLTFVSALLSAVSIIVASLRRSRIESDDILKES